MGCHFLLQGIFPTQGSKSGLLHWQVDSLPLNHLGSPFVYLTTIRKYLIKYHLQQQTFKSAKTLGINVKIRVFKK